MFRQTLRAPENRILWACLALHFALGGIYLCLLPLWGAVPDEPLHYSHIKFVGEFWRLPLITDPRDFGGSLADYCFTADPVGTAQHGPLYYWSAAPLFWISKGLTVQSQLYLLRVLSLLWGAAMLPFVCAILKRVFRSSPQLAGALLVCVTLLPHRLLMSAVIYNDIACATMLSLAFWTLARALEDDATWKSWLWAGVALGLAALTKRVALVAFPAFLLGLWMTRAQGTSKTALLKNAGAFLAAFCVVAGWWFLRDVSLYGELFPTEPLFARRTWADLLLYAPAEQLRFMFFYALRGLWLSLWSQVGWIPWDVGGCWGAFSLFLYGEFALVSIACALGFFAGIRSKWRGADAYARRWAWLSLLVIVGMIYGALRWVLLSSFHGSEETGKHAIAISACVLIVLGMASRFWLKDRAPLLPLCLAGLLALFNIGSLVYLSTVLIPRFRPPTPALASMRVADLPSGRAPGIWHRYRVPGVSQLGGEVPRPAKARPPLHFQDFPTP